MRYLIILLFTASIYAQESVKEELFRLFGQKEFTQVCRFGFQNYGAFKKDENYVSLYGFGCLYADFIDRLAIPITALKNSKDARTNAAYFAVILMQKKLLYHALLDGYNFESLHLPTTDYVLSKVFDLYAKLPKSHKKTLYIFKDPQNPKQKYKLYLKQENGVTKMVIDEYYNNMLVKQHMYW